MPEQSATLPRVRPRQSLSGRLWLLATLAVLMAEVVVFLPYMAQARRGWLEERVNDVSIAVLAAPGRSIEPAGRDALLRAVSAAAIRLTNPDGSIAALGDQSAQAVASIDLQREGLAAGILRSLRDLLTREDRLASVVAVSPNLPQTRIELLLRQQALCDALRRVAVDFSVPALLIAAVTGGIVYLGVLLLLVRPMRRITGSIAAFRGNPESTPPLDPDAVTVMPETEIGIAGRELAAMQHELRAALWRNARLAALGAVVAKVSHDLRGILTPALLTAERLELNADPKVQRAGETVAQAVERATELVRRTLDYARDEPPSLVLAPVELARLVNDAAATARSVGAGLLLADGVDPALLVNADRTHLFRVFANLLRNAAEAGARTVRVSAVAQGPTVTLDLADDGPGLPEPVQAALFRPFAGVRRGGTGLGLAIARDLMVAHGGAIELVETGAAGTTFRLTLRAAEAAAAAGQAQPASGHEAALDARPA